MNKVCACDLHKERIFMQTLKSKLEPAEYNKLEAILEDKWMQADDLIIAKAKYDETWSGSKYRKALIDMHKLGWFDNLTFVELANKAAKL